MLSDLVLPIICKKYNITCVLFSRDFQVVEYSENIEELTSIENHMEKDDDVRDHFWEFVGMENQFEELYLGKEKTLHVPMIFKNNNYFDIDIEICEIIDNKRFFLAMFTKQTKFSANYTEMIQQINHDTLKFEYKKEDMETSEHYYNLINENLISFHVDRDGIITEVNEACAFFFGFVGDEMLGHHFSTFFTSREVNNGFVQGNSKILRAVDTHGTDVFFHADIIPIRDKKTICENIIICQDITYLKRVETELEYAVHHDSLTGLPNRTLLLKRLEELLAKSKEGDELSFALCFIDLDKFKGVNDNLGHHAGDMLLKHVGEELSGVVRDCDTIARIGGDEFIILFENLGVNDDFLPSTLKRIEQLKVEKPLKYTEDIVIPFGFSLGLSIYPDNGLDIKSLMAHADKKMYEVKKNRDGSR